ncbi:MerR family transcriptional regulator [Mycolicibacterium sp. P1-18]|uniref:MerR family transcriptional regulator n=1 Tax=Mycolicibacterium sp. P1-18 TaxID=2024615 RepID=UPI0011F2D396|nr:MerR family transcriptional regulator [Mycolicibacterium sp. P1-18]KAA0098576.1 MerR family transcriptional regulator [Mycolicibacterium sp. P1-18]
MKIGELARRTGASVRSLRYYEQRRLLLAHRTPGGQRTYGDDAVERVMLIKELFAAGLGSDGVVQLLPCVDSGTATSAMVERLVCERARIDADVSRLAATRDRLDQLIVQTRRHVVVRPADVGP